jgi:hypothetical protein
MYINIPCPVPITKNSVNLQYNVTASVYPKICLKKCTVLGKKNTKIFWGRLDPLK